MRVLEGKRLMKKWKTYFLYPFMIFLLVFIFIALLFILGVETDQNWVWICGLLIVVVGVLFLGKRSKPTNVKEGVKIGNVWSLLFFIFDAVTIVPFEGWNCYSDWRAFLPYIVPLVITPLIAGYEKRLIK
ncbi:MAG: hypothetical protein NWF07_11170 [Candidatus Bathyarchaeota archaeon]|nr:hypothetical protein [Candidatus Bathyarchaeota archaeon]